MIFCPQLNSKTGDTFKGFIIRGFKKSVSDPKEEIPAGRFLDTNPEARRMPCHDQTSVTHTNNKDKSSQPFNKTLSTSSQNQDNGNIISNQKCLLDKNKDSTDANLDVFIGDDNDNPALYPTNKSHDNEVRIFRNNKG